MFELPSVKIGSKPREKRSCIYITDKESNNLKENWRQTVFLDMNIFSSKKLANHIQMPFSINPEFYRNGSYKIAIEYRRERRTIKAFFSGNQETSEYDHPIFTDFFNILSRTTLLNTLSTKLPEDRMLLIEKGNLNQISQNEYLNKFVLIKWSWTPTKSVNLTSRIQNYDWFSTLAKCDFFVAAPGIRMPMCFNVIEAMSVGCIPILEYAHHFNPKLEHLRNCISFDGEKDLLNKMNLIFEMDESLIKDLRKNVVEYYDEHLAPGKLCDELEKRREKNIKLYLYATEVSYQEYIKTSPIDEK